MANLYEVYKLRRQYVAQVRGQLARDGAPRLQMLVIVLLTGGFGFITSALLLRFGFEHMWQRYALSFIFAYLAFLVFLWFWVKSNADLIAYSNANQPPSTLGSLKTPSSNWGVIDPATADVFAIPIFVCMCAFLIFLLICSAFFVVYSAPVIFAELSVDVFLTARLYQGLKNVSPHLWLQTAIKRTWWPFLLMGIFFVAIGFFIEQSNPDIHSIGEFFMK